jgi:pantoate--beta-alanine ligase
MLRNENCNFVFAPSDSEMYPEPDQRVFNFGEMGKVMEGKHRPGHFNGVAQIVTRLFEIVEPDRAYFGQKDFQQLAIIRKLVSDMDYTTEIVACPIIREPDGLAMSSRNMLLSEQERKSAPLIYQILQRIRKQFAGKSVSALVDLVKQEIEKSTILQLEYFQIVETRTLQPVTLINPEIPVTACIAVYAGNIRLIDNIELIS